MNKQRITLAKLRTARDMKYDILKALYINGALVKSKIVNKTGIEFKRFKDFFDYFLENDYIKYVDGQKFSLNNPYGKYFGWKVELAEKGIEYIKEYENF